LKQIKKVALKIENVSYFVTILLLLQIRQLFWDRRVVNRSMKRGIMRRKIMLPYGLPYEKKNNEAQNYVLILGCITISQHKMRRALWSRVGRCVREHCARGAK